MIGYYILFIIMGIVLFVVAYDFAKHVKESSRFEGYLKVWDVEFVKHHRNLGYSDEEIAKMEGACVRYVSDND